METTLGKRITNNRKRLGLAQDQLAEKLGITAQAVSKWENDRSCPDITILPKLADIFGITIDELLGREPAVPVCETHVLMEEDAERNGFTYNNGNMDFHWDGIKLEGIGLACWVLLTGIIYLLCQLIPIDVSFWNILWPSFLLILGIFGLYPKFSVFRLGCALTGAYFLADKLHIFSITFNSGIIIAVILLFFGLALLVDSLRKGKHRHHANVTDNMHHRKSLNDYSTDGDRFSYDASFGSCTQIIQLEKLRFGEISTSFGEYTVDLSQIPALEEPCTLNASCCFGELTILVPRHYMVISDTSTSFAEFNLNGQPGTNPRGTIYLHTDVSFGEITVEYI